MLQKENLQLLKSKLEKIKKSLEAQIKDLQTVPEFGTDVDHFEEEANEAEEFGKNLGISETLKHHLADVKDALGKIEKGSYGKCEECSKAIELEILELDPESRYCKSCKGKK